jgi:RND family efflux transporter MFP subunit
MAAAGTPLMTVQDTSIVKMQGEVPQEIIPLLSLGQKVKINVNAFPGQSFDAEITRIGPAATATGQYFPVVISIDNAGKLMPGMTGKASLQGSVSGVIIPLAAIYKDNGRDYVYVIKEGKACRQSVTLGKHNASQIHIISGIGKGDVVAISNINILQDGMKIKS